MIQSMTGYGRGECATSTRKITVEIKSLNSKQLDLSARIPSIYREKEYEIRNSVAKALSRGKVDLFVGFENLQSSAGTSAAGAINMELFSNYYRQIKAAADNIGHNTMGDSLISAILRMPEVFQTETVTATAEEFDALLKAADQAIANIVAFRRQEGRVLIDDLTGRVDTIERLMNLVLPFEGERIETVRARITENLERVKVNIDNNRFEQEIIYYLEKFDITEEKVRLKQHCDYFRTVAGETDSVGRKLGFIAQEMGREINTMGSKANHSQIQKIVVEMKDELEKIKEQLLNIL